MWPLCQEPTWPWVFLGFARSFKPPPGLWSTWTDAITQILVSWAPIISHSIPQYPLYILYIYGYGSIPINIFLVGWTSIYQLFWCSPGVPGFWPIPIYIKSSLGRTTPETNHKPVFFEAIWWCLSYRFGNGEKHYFQVFVWKWCSPEFSVISHHFVPYCPTQMAISGQLFPHFQTPRHRCSGVAPLHWWQCPSSVGNLELNAPLVWDTMVDPWGMFRYMGDSINGTLKWMVYNGKTD